ncbi:MAG TPA: hypothetical protein VIH10_07415, partial [Kribbella sp.]
LLNTELQSGTFEITKLNSQADQLRDQQEQLEKQVRTLESPQNLSDRALGMGMVPNPNPVFLRLSDGRVLGVPEEGKAGAGTAMFGVGTPAGTATTKPPTVKPPTVKPPVVQTPVKPPVKTPVKPPVKPVVKPKTPVKPPAGTTKPPATTTKKPPATTTGG